MKGKQRRLCLHNLPFVHFVQTTVTFHRPKSIVISDSWKAYGIAVGKFAQRLPIVHYFKQKSIYFIKRKQFLYAYRDIYRLW